MKIHTDILTMRTIFAAVPDGCSLAIFTGQDGNQTDIDQTGSRSHDRAYVVRLSGSSKYNMQRLSEKSATWDEWGIFIANLFRLDAQAKIGNYKTLDDFIAKTTAERDRVAQYRPDIQTMKAPWLEPNVEDDEFKCDSCGEIWDIEDSIRREDFYLCPGCAGLPI